MSPFIELLTCIYEKVINVVEVFCNVFSNIIKPSTNINDGSIDPFSCIIEESSHSIIICPFANILDSSVGPFGNIFDSTVGPFNYILAESNNSIIICPFVDIFSYGFDSITNVFNDINNSIIVEESVNIVSYVLNDFNDILSYFLNDFNDILYYQFSLFSDVLSYSCNIISNIFESLCSVFNCLIDPVINFWDHPPKFCISFSACLGQHLRRCVHSDCTCLLGGKDSNDCLLHCVFCLGFLFY